MQILINGDNVVTAACAVGSYDGGIEVDNIPQAVLACPQAWIYSDSVITDGEDNEIHTAVYTANTDYTAPEETEDVPDIPQIMAKIDELTASVDLLILDTL